jgi:2,4-diaminopentanoate dehydrogenase
MSGSAYRVAHYGTGDTGAQALKGILGRAGFELVAHLVHSPDKVGRDSGEIVGLDPAGVRATADLDEFLAVDADCVSYFATDFGRDPDEVITEMCAMLASGKNVVTSTMPALAYPPALPKDVLGRLERACAEGSTSFFCSGIAPGFTPDALVLACSSLCERVTSVTVAERVFMGTYQDPMTFQYLGFGRTLAEHAATPHSEIPSDAFSATFSMLGDGLGITFDEVRARRDVAVADKDYTCAAGPIPEGTVASVRLGFEGLVDGEPRITTGIIYSMIDTVVDEWLPRVLPDAPPDARTTQVVITGAPDVDCHLVLSGSDQPGVDATAARVINAIPATCGASPGLHSPLTLFVWGDHVFTS